jgi:hypothetical protein
MFCQIIKLENIITRFSHVATTPKYIHPYTQRHNEQADKPNYEDIFIPLNTSMAAFSFRIADIVSAVRRNLQLAILLSGGCRNWGIAFTRSTSGIRKTICRIEEFQSI